mgnify:CR=1 FL=1
MERIKLIEKTGVKMNIKNTTCVGAIANIRDKERRITVDE